MRRWAAGVVVAGWMSIAAQAWLIVTVPVAAAQAPSVTPAEASAPSPPAKALTELQQLTAVIVRQQQTIARLNLEIGELRTALARVEISKADGNIDAIERAYVTALGGDAAQGDRLDWATMTLAPRPVPGNATPVR